MTEQEPSEDSTNMNKEERIMDKRSGKNRTVRYLTLAGLCMLTVSGCAQTPSDGQDVIVVEQEAEPVAYDMAVVMLGDVRKTQQIRCTYQQLNDESLSFGISGLSVKKVYVQEGDVVEKGQVLAELSGASRQEDIARLEYQIARNQLQMDYVQINEDYEISTLWLNYLYQSSQSDSDRERLDEGVAQVQQNYSYAREDYQDAMNLDLLQLEQIRQEERASRLVAGMSGTVSHIKERLEGSTSVRGEEVLTIIDGSECLFTTETPEYASCFREGEEVDMQITSGSGAGEYTLLPHEMEQWGERQMFSLAGGGENATIEVGTAGTIVAVVDQRSQVLCVPAEAVHSADGRDYVYVLGDDQTREVKWIETGLHGDSSVEVLSGLTEGERVILR